jgi:hypothetical protein
MSVNYRKCNCPASAIFEVLADPWRYPAWVVGASRTRAVTGAWPQPGSALHHSFGLWPLVIDDITTIDVWEPDRHVELHPKGWPIGVARVLIDVQDHGDYCVVRLTEDAVRGPARLVPRALRDVVGVIRNRETLRRLADQAERPQRGLDEAS